jgi:hypothetical protein
MFSKRQVSDLAFDKNNKSLVTILTMKNIVLKEESNKVPKYF